MRKYIFLDKNNELQDFKNNLEKIKFFLDQV